MDDKNINTNNNKLYSNKSLHKMLTDTISSGRLCHAYLFYGKSGVGKRFIAKYFAQTILCRNDGEKKPCFNCASCKKISNNNHPDVFINENNKTTKNSIHVEDIRFIRQDAYIKPNESEYKIYIIPNAHNMTISAANALLKILEEPPQNTLFILTAENKKELPETIVSRCITLEVFDMTDDELLVAIKDIAQNKTQKEYENAVVFSNGNIGRALDFLNNESSLEIQDKLNNILMSIANRDEYSLLVHFTNASKNKEQLFECICEIISQLRLSMLNKLNIDNIYSETLVLFSSKITLNQIQNIILVLEKAKINIDQNANLTLLANEITLSIINSMT